MEHTKLSVRSVDIDGTLGLARVEVISTRKLGNRPVAKIIIECAFDGLGMSRTHLRRRAREIAVDFLNLF